MHERIIGVFISGVFQVPVNHSTYMALIFLMNKTVTVNNEEDYVKGNTIVIQLYIMMIMGKISFLLC